MSERGGVPHTPLPWSLASGGRLIIREEPCISDECDHYSVALLTAHSLVLPEQAKANAAFIVKACNAHDRLISALTDIAYVAEHGRPVEGKNPNAVAEWIGKHALAALSEAGSPADGLNESKRQLSPSLVQGGK